MRQGRDWKHSHVQLLQRKQQKEMSAAQENRSEAVTSSDRTCSESALRRPSLTLLPAPHVSAWSLHPLSSLTVSWKRVRLHSLSSLLLSLTAPRGGTGRCQKTPDWQQTCSRFRSHCNALPVHSLAVTRPLRMHTMSHGRDGAHVVTWTGRVACERSRRGTGSDDVLTKHWASCQRVADCSQQSRTGQRRRTRQTHPDRDVPDIQRLPEGQRWPDSSRR